MTESLEKIRKVLARCAPSIGSGKRVTCPELIDEAMLFTGQRLAYLVSQNIDRSVELSVCSRDRRETSVTLLRCEHWRTVAKVMILLENNAVGWIQSDEAIELRDRGSVDTVVDSSSCR